MRSESNPNLSREVRNASVWNTVYVHAAIEHLTAEGFINDLDDLSRTSPTQRTHINPYGRYTFETEPANDTLRPLRNIERPFAP